MKLRVGSYSRKKIVILSVLAVSMLFIFAGNSQSETYDEIKLYPEHVGVFTSVGEQQFVAFGRTSSGPWVNITTEVDWESSDEKIVTINDYGVAKVVQGNTFGQVKITCSYPKKPQSITAPSILLLN